MITITAHVGETRDGRAMCELRDETGVVAKMYANAEGTKILIIMKELVNFGQTLINPDMHCLEVTRKQ